MKNWNTCIHSFRPYFGPVLHCVKCGASTMASMDGKPKSILPPPDYTNLDAGKDTEE